MLRRCPSDLRHHDERGEHHETGYINPVLLSTRPAIQFGVSSPHDQSSEAPFGRATVRRWQSEYPAASIPPPFAAPTVRRSSFRPGQEQADVLSERPPHGRREPIDRHHCGLALPRVL